MAVPFVIYTEPRNFVSPNVVGVKKLDVGFLVRTFALLFFITGTAVFAHSTSSSKSLHAAEISNNETISLEFTQSFEQAPKSSQLKKPDSVIEIEEEQEDETEKDERQKRDCTQDIHVNKSFGKLLLSYVIAEDQHKKSFAHDLECESEHVARFLLFSEFKIALS